MKKRITDMLDDIPQEYVEELVTKQNKRKHRNYFVLKAAVVAAVVLCMVGGGIGYAATKYPGIFGRYFSEENEELKDVLVNEGKKVAENQDYRMTVESVMSDQTFTNIFVSVEALNENSKAELEKCDEKPIAVFSNKKGETDIGLTQEITGGAKPKDGKNYYTIETWIGADACRIEYGNGLMISDVQYKGPWYQKHQSEFLIMDFEIPETTKEKITIHPGKITDGISHTTIDIYAMGFEGWGKADEKSYWVDEYPEVIAFMKDGTTVKIMEGNTGYTKKTDMECGTLGGSEGPVGELGEEFSYKWSFEKVLNLKEIKRIEVNGKRVKIEK